MAKAKVSTVSKLRRQAEKGDLSDDVTIVYRLRGGAGEEAIEESVIFTTAGRMSVRVRGGPGMGRMGDSVAEIPRKEALDLSRMLLKNVEQMVPASEARFVPDSLVGSVTFAIGNEKETFYFLADEDDGRSKGQPVKANIRKIMDRFRKVQTSCLSGARLPSAKPEKEAK